jgi:hypothetical protein
MIGIKIADGTYIPILDESERDKKKVILTTVRDEQPSVQIDLYRGTGSEMEDPQYLDTLKIDQIAEALKGEPEIELILGVDDEGKLIATARDLEGGAEKSFEVDLAAAPGSEPFSYDADSDFDLSAADGGEDADAGDKSEPVTASYSPMNGQSASIHETREGKNHKPLLLLALAALLIAGGVLCWFFLFRDKGEETAVSAPPAPVETPAPRPASPAPTAPAPVTPAPPAPTPAPSAQAEPAKPAAPVAPASDKKQGTGVWYSIVRGDNLWNLSKSFYRTPWRFKQIAAENDIRNPDLIYAGNRIYIPDVETEKKR